MPAEPHLLVCCRVSAQAAAGEAPGLTPADLYAERASKRGEGGGKHVSFVYSLRCFFSFL